MSELLALSQARPETYLDGYLLYVLNHGELMVISDPDEDEALSKALLSPEFVAGPERWLTRYVDTLPLGWDIHLFEYAPLELVK